MDWLLDLINKGGATAQALIDGLLNSNVTMDVLTQVNNVLSTFSVYDSSVFESFKSLIEEKVPDNELVDKLIQRVQASMTDMNSGGEE